MADADYENLLHELNAKLQNEEISIEEYGAQYAELVTKQLKV